MGTSMLFRVYQKLQSFEEKNRSTVVYVAGTIMTYNVFLTL